MKLISLRIFIIMLLLLFLSLPSGVAYHTHIIQVKDLFLPTHSELRKQPITHIVIHSISNVVEKPTSPFQIIDIYYLLLEYGVSAHYIIDRDGTIYQLVHENRVAYHAGKSSLPSMPFFPHNMNDFSIGIELMGIGTKEEMKPFISEENYRKLNPAFIGFTEEQYTSLSALLAILHERYPTIPKSRYHVIGHDDYAPGRKTDPGSLFHWERIGYDH